MFLKIFILLLTFVVLAVHAIYDPTYTGIKTKSYRRDPQISEALMQQQQQQRFTVNQNQHANNRQTINSDATERLSPINNNKNIHYQHQENGAFYQQKLPIYQRNFHERHAAASQQSSNWNDAENAITEYYTGCPSYYTGQLAYAYDCRRFLNCFNGRGHIQSCAPGTVFNPATLECDRPDKVLCGAHMGAIASQTQSQPSRMSGSANQRAGRLRDANVEQFAVQCPVGVTGLHPHPTDCTKFLNCDRGSMHIQSCGPGTAYSASMMVCDFKHKVDCSGREGTIGNGAYPDYTHGTAYADNRKHAASTAAVVCPPGVTGLHRHPYDCYKFLNCAHGNTIVQACDRGTTFDSQKLICDYTEKRDCSPSYKDVSVVREASNMLGSTNNERLDASAGDILCPTGVSGLFPYPFDYTKFMNCKNGNTAIQNCVANTVFSISKRFCDMKDNVLASDHVTYIISDITYEYSQTVQICPPGMHGIHLFPYDCTKYLSCTQDKMLLLTCPTGMVFSISRKECLSDYQVQAGDRVEYASEWRQTTSTQIPYKYLVDNAVTISCPDRGAAAYPYPFDCTKYFRCDNGKIMVEVCADDSVFSLSKKRCDNKDQVVPKERVAFGYVQGHDRSITDTRYNANTQKVYNSVEYLACPTGLNGFYLHPFDCTRYIKCSNGVTTLESCTPSTVFSISQQHCVPRDQLEAYDRVEYFTQTQNEFSTETELSHTQSQQNINALHCPRGFYGLLPHPYDCTQFLNCSNGQMLLEQCTPGSVFSISSKTCDLHERVDATDRSEYARTTVHGYSRVGNKDNSASSNEQVSIKEHVACPAVGNGLFPHPYDCAKYLNCVNGVSSTATCQTGTVWDIAMEVCDLRHKVDCGGRQDYQSVKLSGEISETKHYIDSIGVDLVTCPLGRTGLYPYPFDCTKYLNCRNGKTIIQNCIAGSVFSISKKFCDLKEHVNAPDRVPFVHEYGHELISETEDDITQSMPKSEPLICPAGASGLHLHPFDCTKYLKCENNRAVMYACPAGMVFSLMRKLCVLQSLVNGNDRVEYMTETDSSSTWESNYKSPTLFGLNSVNSYIECPPGATGMHPHPYDCTKFLNCANGVTHIQDCGTGTAWNVELQVCDFAHKVDCKSRLGSLRTDNTGDKSSSVKCAEGATGVQPHPFACTQFLNCANGVTHIQECGPGTAWNIAMEVCDFIANVDCSGRNNSATTSLSSSHAQKDYEFTYNNRGSKSYENANSRTNQWVSQESGSKDGSWNYQHQEQTSAMPTNQYAHPQQQTSYGRQPIGVGSTTTSGSIYSQPPGHHDRWTNMNMARPDLPTINSPQDGYYSRSDNTGQQQIHTNWNVENPPKQSHTATPASEVSSWSGSGSSIHRQSPSHTVLYVEGSLQPNRNYAHTRTYSAPLAPLLPSTNIPTNTNINTTSSAPTNIYYAQPVGSEEATEEAFDDISGGDLSPVRTTMHRTRLTSSHTSNRNDHSRDRVSSPSTMNTWTSNVHAPTFHAVEPSSESLPIPNQHLMPPYPTSSQHGTSQSDSRTPTHTTYTDSTISDSINIPVTHLMPPLTYDSSHQVPQPELNVTTIIVDNLPGTTWTIDASNLYGNMQPPPPPSTSDRILPTPKESNKNHPVINEENLYGGLQPPVFTQTQLPTTPETYLRPPANPTIPMKHASPSATKTHVYQIYPPLRNATLQSFPRDPHYSPSYAAVVHSHNTTWPNFDRKLPAQPFSTTRSTPKPLNAYDRESVDDTNHQPPSSYNRQYYNPSAVSRPNDETNTNDMAMQQLPISDALRMLLRPYFNRSGTIGDDAVAQAESHIMNLAAKPTPTLNIPNTASATTIRPRTHVGEHEDDVELIFTGEQQSMVARPTQSETHSIRTEFHSSQPNIQNSFNSAEQENSQRPQHNPNWHKHNHSYDFHMSHPNPYKPDERSSSASTHNRNWHNHHHEHSREFHLRHPNIPNPFGTTTATREGDKSVVDKQSADYPNSNAESTTPLSIFPRIDVRVADANEDCPFNCGNGNCVKDFEVCDGVNNCGNRKDEAQCDHLGYEVRLSGGESSNMGRIEVKVLGKWGYVCDDKFGLRDADVVCKELGFKLGASEVRGNSYYPAAETAFSFVMDEVDCGGNETALKECNFKGWGVNNCGPDEIVGVVCKVPLLKCPNNYWLCSTSKECIPPAFVCDNTADCADKSDESDRVCNSPIEYRLEGGRSSNEGRLEVMYRGEWGTVCDDDFGQNEAQVVCNSLGFYGRPKIEKNIFGLGSGPIWLDQVSCFGNETAIDKCHHWTWGEHNCNHTEDVGLRCTAGPPPKKSTVGTTVLGVKSGSFGVDKQRSLEESATTLEDIGLYSVQLQRSSKFMNINNQKRCGQFKNELLDEYEHPEERVVNGTVAKRGHHPWQATIRTKGRGGISSHWCGAVLISKKHLLTAAHCLVGYPKGAYFIRMGDHYANIAESSETDSYIENWYIHEKFRDKTHMNNDIALIVLKNPVRFNDYIQPICLPENGATLKTNRMCTISGWGSIKSGVSTPSNILRAAQLPILSDETCKQAHVYGTSMTEGMFCAGSMDESVDACDGDSGGPLVCSDEDGETLYGIISWGQQCGYANKPGVYVRVEKYIDWIYEKINFSMQQSTN